MFHHLGALPLFVTIIITKIFVKIKFNPDKKIHHLSNFFKIHFLDLLIHTQYNHINEYLRFE